MLVKVHELGITHNDFNFRNIVVNALAESMLIDFGICSTPGGNYDFKSSCGPEGKNEFEKSPLSDIYSLGFAIKNSFQNDLMLKLSQRMMSDKAHRYPRTMAGAVQELLGIRSLV